MASHALNININGSGSLTPTTLGQGKRLPIEFLGEADLNIDTDNFSYIRNLVLLITATAIQSMSINNILIERSQVWWNKSYTYRRVLEVPASPTGIEAEHPLVALVSKAVLKQNKARFDLADFEVLRLVSHVPEQWQILPKTIELLDEAIKFTWDNKVTMDNDEVLDNVYYIYYGNDKLVNIPDTEDEDYVPNLWFIKLVPDSEELDYTRPEEHWFSGTSEIYHAKMTLKFYGDRVRIHADVGSIFGIAEIQIDDNEWEEFDLYSHIEDNQIIYTKENLEVGFHYLRYRVSGRKHPNASSYKINFTEIDYLKHNIAINLYEEADETLMWGSVIGGVIGG